MMAPLFHPNAVFQIIIDDEVPFLIDESINTVPESVGNKQKTWNN